MKKKICTEGSLLKLSVKQRSEITNLSPEDITFFDSLKEDYRQTINLAEAKEIMPSILSENRKAYLVLENACVSGFYSTYQDLVYLQSAGILILIAIFDNLNIHSSRNLEAPEMSNSEIEEIVRGVMSNHRVDHPLNFKLLLNVVCWLIENFSKIRVTFIDDDYFLEIFDSEAGYLRIMRFLLLYLHYKNKLSVYLQGKVKC